MEAARRRSKTAWAARLESYLQSRCRYSPPPACKHASPVCVHCVRDDERARHRRRCCTLCRLRIAAMGPHRRRRGVAVYFSPNVIIFARGIVPGIRYRRFRICARVSLPVLSLSIYIYVTPRRVVWCTHRRCRGRYGFSRQYANAFHRSGEWIKKKEKERERERERKREKKRNETKSGGWRWEKMAESKQPAAPTPRAVSSLCSSRYT